MELLVPVHETVAELRAHRAEGRYSADDFRMEAARLHDAMKIDVTTVNRRIAERQAGHILPFPKLLDDVRSRTLVGLSEYVSVLRHRHTEPDALLRIQVVDHATRDLIGDTALVAVEWYGDHWTGADRLHRKDRHQPRIPRADPYPVKCYLHMSSFHWLEQWTDAREKWKLLYIFIIPVLYPLYSMRKGYNRQQVYGNCSPLLPGIRNISKKLVDTNTCM